MSIKPISSSVNCTLTKIGQRARLPVAIAGFLLSAQSQAFLPTPLSIMTTGELADNSTPELVTALQQNVVTAKAIAPLSSNVQTDAQKPPNSAAESLLNTWRTQVKTENLAQHTTWRRLLYFYDGQNRALAKKKTESLIDDPSFFLSERGQQDSGAELDDMLVVLAQELTQSSTTNDKRVNTQANRSISCRFPARVAWLKNVLTIDDASLPAECPELDEWTQKLAPEQLSIMFAQEYLDNPTSAFAHTLLRIDSKASVADPSQIHHAYALNYTVGGNPADSFPVYAVKSMIGGYDSIIEIDLYPERFAKYIQDDERDAWTYQLNLTPSEVQQIIRHVWETKDLELPYYFATDNCASEILRLIDVVRPQQHLLSQLPYVVVPSDVVQLLNKESLLGSTNYTPADSTLRQAQLNEVKQQRDQLGYHNSAKQTVNEIKSAQLNPVSSMSDNKQTLLPRSIAVSDNNPIDRHPLQLGYVGMGQRGDNNYIDIGVRAGYHDTLDRPSGFLQFFDLEGAAATLRLYDKDDHSSSHRDSQPKSVVLQNVTLIRGRSFNPINSAKKGKTWGATIEATRVNDGSQENGTDHLVGSVGYESGWSWAFGTPKANTGEMPPQLCYTFLSGTAQTGRGLNKGFRVGTGINAGCRYQINNQLRAQAELQLPYWYHGNSNESDVRGHYWQPISTLGLQYDIDKKQALRINASYDWQDRVADHDDVQLSYRRYF
ncbi:DUF4105 domain-containing protein [Psychrobacter sp. 1176_08]|uniref:Lnb N-terminal periplasmic domain-containing protein n=1 Tax=Psychrobacter sp. 1176_08 TaxID=2604452 RepID=UPI004064BC44